VDYTYAKNEPTEQMGSGVKGDFDISSQYRKMEVAKSFLNL
jgi:hypothetical protein